MNPDPLFVEDACAHANGRRVIAGVPICVACDAALTAPSRWPIVATVAVLVALTALAVTLRITR